MMTTKEYLDSTHRFGRTAAIIALCLMVAAPFAVGLALGAMPDFLAVLAASVGLLAIFVPVTLSEVLAFTPVLGSSIYLTLITGNVTNLKIPTAANAMRIVNVEQGSERGDVVSAIAVAISSITTVAILAVGALLMVPLKPILLLPAVQTATAYILPALFGAFGVSMLTESLGGGIRAKGRLLGALPPIVLMAVLFFAVPKVMQLQGVLILLMLPVTYYGSKLLYKKGLIKVSLPEDAGAKGK